MAENKFPIDALPVGCTRPVSPLIAAVSLDPEGLRAQATAGEQRRMALNIVLSGVLFALHHTMTLSPAQDALLHVLRAGHGSAIVHH